MSAYAIAEAFRSAFVADEDFAGIDCKHEQTSDHCKYPVLGFAAKVTPMNASSSAMRYQLTVTAISNADRKSPEDDDPAIAHSELVDKVLAKLLGAGKADLRDTLNEAGDFDFRGWSPDTTDPGVSDRTFETATVVNGTALAV